MKYEAVFGDQRLFDGAPEECFCVAKNVYDSRIFYKAECGALFWLDDDEWKPLQFMSCTPLAMRRIIRTPTWSVADQKAGKLPEVGCRVEYFANNEHGDTEVTAQWRSGDELEILRHQNKNKAFVVFNKRTEQSSNLIINCMNPIESPEEKAARLRHEWVEKAVGATPVYEIATHGYSTQLRIDISSIYDAMQSGELPMPNKESE